MDEYSQSLFSQQESSLVNNLLVPTEGIDFFTGQMHLSIYLGKDYSIIPKHQLFIIYLLASYLEEENTKFFFFVNVHHCYHGNQTMARHHHGSATNLLTKF